MSGGAQLRPFIGVAVVSLFFPFLVSTILVSTSKSTSTRMCSVQDSVLPRGVGLRKPHIFSFPLPPYFLLLSSHISLLTPHSFLLTIFTI